CLGQDLCCTALENTSAQKRRRFLRQVGIGNPACCDLILLRTYRHKFGDGLKAAQRGAYDARDGAHVLEVAVDGILCTERCGLRGHAQTADWAEPDERGRSCCCSDAKKHAQTRTGVICRDEVNLSIPVDVRYRH